ncbi:MAG: DMT family transporter [Spirochaetaceae bacterium]|nr:DMT family transporter [Spirochaetaceae bacterium]
MKKRYLLLAFTPTIIWGFGYVVQSIGLTTVGVNTLNATRFILAFIVLLPVLYIRRKNIYKKEPNKLILRRATLIKGSIVSGIFLFIANTFQFWGMLYTTPGKASFITSLYIVIVPFLSLYFGEKISKKVWIGVLLALIGMYLLCFTKGISGVNIGDLLVLVSAFGFSFQIISISYYAPMCDAFSLAAFHILIAGILSGITMFILETPTLIAIKAAWFPIVYSAIFVSAIGYTFQILSQQKLSPTIASLVFSFESVFALFFGWLLLNEKLSNKELIGCVFVLIAILITQASPLKIKKIRNKKTQPKKVV